MYFKQHERSTKHDPNIDKYLFGINYGAIVNLLKICKEFDNSHDDEIIFYTKLFGIYSDLISIDFYQNSKIIQLLLTRLNQYETEFQTAIQNQNVSLAEI